MRLEDCHVGVVGVGLIGGSLAAALVENGSARSVSGWDSDRTALEFALKRGIVAKAAPSLEALVAEVDLLVLAVPIRHLVPVSREALSSAGEGLKAVFDVASVRAGIGEELSHIWGGIHMGFHPMAGKERGGVANATAELFKEATVALIPSDLTSHESKNLGFQLASALGARALILGAEEHDEIVACVSHLPMIVASALSLVAGERMEELPELPCLAAGGFRDTTRVASGPSWLVSDVWARNGKAIGNVLERFVEVIEMMGKTSPGEMEKLAEKARGVRETVLAGISRRCSN